MADKNDALIGNRESRCYGIDLLRVIAMLMVVTMHILGHGGVLSNTKLYSINYEIGWALDTIAYSAVDVYVMITGFVYANRNVRSSKILLLWCAVFFYSVLIPIVLKSIGYHVQLTDILCGLFPVLSKQYWFFDAYLALFLFVPLLNHLLLNKRLLTVILNLSFFLFSFLPLIGLGNDLFGTKSGSSFLWFVVLYLSGGFLKVYGCPSFLSVKKARIFFWISIAIMLLSRNVLSIITEAVLGTPRGDVLYSYCSPFVVLCAICLVVIFSKRNFSSPKLCHFITLLSSLTFGVYLIHDNPSFRTYVIKNAFVQYATLPAGMFLLRVVATIFIVFIFSAIVEYIRTLLFKLLRIPTLLSKIESSPLFKRISAQITWIDQ